MMVPIPISRRAFSLIELLIAVSLGATIITVAVSGMRMAQTATTALTRMSVENALLRLAAEQALDEVDLWTSVDDVSNKDGQLLRGLCQTPYDGNGAGQPFTPFAAGWRPVAAQPRFNGGAAERSLGYNPGVMAWAPNDPRTWPRLNMVQRNYSAAPSDVRQGDYSLFSTADVHLASRCSYDPSRCRSWYDSQVRTTMDALGFYGLCEYLPSSAIFALHGDGPLSGPRGVMPGGTSRSMTTYNRSWFGSRTYWLDTPRGRGHTTDLVAFDIPNPQVPMDTKPGEGLRSAGEDPTRVFWEVGAVNVWTYDGGTAEDIFAKRSAAIDQFLKHTGHIPFDLPVRPASWPEVNMVVSRFILGGRFVNLCRVTSNDPGTGELVEIPFTCFGTTLRGARQQRTPTSGWSVYDNRNPANPTIGACLDHPAYSHLDRLP